MPADLHCHTKISDGSTTLEDVVLLAKRRGLSAISVTDHDTLAGVTRAKILGDRHGVRVIPGIELSCYDDKRGKKVHLLGYLFDRPDRLEGHCSRVAEARKKAAAQMISRVTRYYPITQEMIVKSATGSTNIFVQHIMQTLMNAGFTDTMFGDLYDKLLNSETGTCRVNFDLPDVFETLELLRSAGAITVLAHPGRYGNLDLLPELIGRGLSGVEVWSPANSEADTAALLKLAKEQHMITTGGTDFHGLHTRKPLPIGAYATPDECLDELMSLKSRMLKAAK